MLGRTHESGKKVIYPSSLDVAVVFVGCRRPLWSVVVLWSREQVAISVKRG
jgi:hypothetical protein